MNHTTIEWVRNPDGSQGYTWNPVTGCEKGCPYCYARRIARRFGKTPEEKDFKLVFHPERLIDPQKIRKPAVIFVCSMADLFGERVPCNWILQVLKACRNTPQHLYLFLTKNPNRYYEFTYGLWPKNYMVGVTVTAGQIPKIQGHDSGHIFVSAEPLLGELEYIWRTRCSWLITGPQTGPKKIEPSRAWLSDLRDLCELEGIAFFMKENLRNIWRGKGLYPRQELIQEFPTTLNNFYRDASDISPPQ